jgi:hypothetical protein
MNHKASASARPLSIVALFFASVTIFVSSPVKAVASVTFRSVVAYDAGAPCLNSVAVADVNADGKPDVLTAGGCPDINEQGLPGSVSVFLGNGDGTFQPSVVYDSGGVDTTSVQVADVNGDGKLDVLAASICSTAACPLPVVAVLVGNGDGTFQAPLTYDSGLQAWSLAVADLNRDGKLDLVVAGSYLPGRPVRWIGVLLGNGDGTFQSVVTYGSGPTASVALSDVNGDGKLDALVTIVCSDAYCKNGFLGVLLGNGDGTFQPGVTYDAGYQPVSLAVADVNGDGKTDALVTKQLTSSALDSAVGVLLGNGDGTFGPVISYDSGAPTAMSLAVGDVNFDGRPDVMVAHCTIGRSNGYSCPGGSGIVSLLRGNADGTFQAPVRYTSGGVWARSVAVADVNGDGSPDLLVANAFGRANGDGTLGVLLNNTPLCTTPPVIRLSTTPTTLWPPNGSMVPVSVSGTVTDAGLGCAIRTTAYTVQDEYGEVQPSGTLTLDAQRAYSFTVWLQASRLGTDPDGRLYRVTVSATDDAGKTGSQSGNVIVSHDQRR